MRDLKRLTSFLCVLALTAGLVVVPAGAAVPMLDAPAVEELPGDVGVMLGHDHVGTPALDPGDKAEMATAAASHAYNFDSTAGDSYVTMSNAKNASAAYTWNNIAFTKGTKMESKTTITFETTGDAKVTLVLTGTSKNINIDGKTTAISKEEMTFEVSAGQHTITKSNSSGTGVVLYYLKWEPIIPSCEVHTWGDWSEDTASCTEGGTKTRTCTVCKETETVETDPTGHTPVAFAKVEATCAEEGRAAGTACSECEAVLTGGETIPATGDHKDADNNGQCDTCGKVMPTAHSHNFATLVRNTATCTAAGVKVMACDWPNCDATQSEDVAALGHDWKNVTVKSATCTAIGWSAHKACTRCDAKEGYTQFPATGHDFDPDTRECKNGCGTVMDSKGMNAGGWFEALYAEIDGVTDAQVAQVIYSGPISGTLEDEDLEFLVRDSSKLASGKSGVRIDVPGIPAGTYSLLVVTTSGIPYSATGIQVQEYDRSGYAHYNYTDGVGAYRDDGILKDNAIVLYVTEENKNTVTVTAPDGTTVTGIGNILNTAGMDNTGTGQCRRVSDGKTYYGIANSNQGILKKLAQADIPLVVRIVGNVSSKHPAPASGGIDGLTAFNSWDYGGTYSGSDGDNGSMARMKDARNVTIEGIGTDATLDGWGIHFMAGSDFQPGGKNFEVRNVAFRNVPEDCLGMEGVQSGSTLTASVERCWIHNCSFHVPNISPAAASDKGQGDGACDFKRGQYMTMSYCYFEGYHKTNLVGSSDSSLQFHITWHHNWWKNCESRGPLGRQANMHIYNCIYEDQVTYAQNVRANCYIFSEYNAFLNCKGPRTFKSGAIKSYNDVLSSCIGDETSSVDTVADKTQTVNSANTYANFDTNPDICYIPSGDYKLDQDMGEARKNILAYTGPMKAEIITPDDVSTSVVEESRMPSAAVVLPFDKDLNNTYITGSGTKDNIVFTLSGVSGTNVKYGKDSVGQYVVFRVDEPVDITMDGTASALINSNGDAVAEVPGSATNLPAGVYYIQPDSIQPAKGSTPMTYKEGTLSHLTITAAANYVPPHEHSYASTGTVVREPSCTSEGVMRYVCTANDDGYKTESIPKIDHNYVDGACEMCGLREGVYDPDAGSGDAPTIPTIVAVTGITLDQESVYVDQDKTVTLIAAVQPADATRKTVTWTSDDPDVATVSNSGMVTGKASGTTTITATTKDGNFTASCIVRVIGITKTEKKFVANDYGPKPQVSSKDQAVTAADVTAIEAKTGSAFTLDKAAGTWKMNGDKTYLVTASKGGNALEFTVTNPLNTVTVSASSTGSSNYSVIALLNESGVRVADKTGATVKALKGTSASGITFENLPVGTYRIVSPDGVTSAEVGGASGFEGRGVGIHSVVVTELQREDDDRVLVTSVTLAGEDTVEMGKSITLTATVQPDDATTPKLKWTSSDAKVATVSNGVVTGAKPGTATITAAATDGSGKKATKTITVTPAIVDQGNLGQTGEQVTWTLDSMGQLAITNTDDHIATEDAVLVALWGDNDRFLGVKLIRASQLTATVGQNWDHLKLIWVNNKYAPKCKDVLVDHDE